MAVTAGVTGHSAVLSIEGAALAESTEFSLHFGQAMADMTNRDSNYWRQLLTTIRDWSISGSGLYIYNDLAKKYLFDHWNARTLPTLTAIFTFADGTVTATGEVIVTSLDVANPHDGPATISFTLEGTDALVLSAS